MPVNLRVRELVCALCAGSGPAQLDGEDLLIIGVGANGGGVNRNESDRD